VYEFIAGLGGRDITTENIEMIFDRLANGKIDKSEIQWIGLKD
jgi:pyruvate/2-oxoacid:ferredoxin oxidoreductase alpha subunit